MPVYAYKGVNAAGKSVTGTRESENPRLIKQNLRKEGIFITELNEAAQVAKAAADGSQPTLRFAALRERVSSQDLAVATRQLATLIGAGIPLVESLTALVDQIENPVFKSVWADVKQKVNEGVSFGDALGSHPRIFSNLYTNMVRAGETSGAMEIVLERLADFTESQAELKAKLVGTMIYPIIMIVMASVVTSILFVFVVPKIAKIFEAQKVALPLPTQVLIFISTMAQNWWYVILPSIAGVIYLIRRYIKSEKGRPKWDRFVLRAPIFGPLVRMVAITRFAKTLGTLVGSGVPLLSAFDIVKTVVQNDLLMKTIETARDAVKEGESIANPLKRSGQFPPIVTHMIAVGEKSGKLEEMLGNIARSYDVQVGARLQALTSLLEPVMLVFMGVVVAFIVFAILLPMMQLTSFAG
jgi:general secretion pathway protein F